MEPDRRTEARTPRRLRVLVGSDEAFTADVTPNGLCLETAHLVLPGKSVTGIILVGAREFEFTGMVCWARSEDPQHGRMGVRFLELSRELRRELESVH